MKTFGKILLVTLLLVLFGGTIYFLYNKSKEEPVVYATEKPVVANIIKKTVATGSILPRKEILLKSKVSGIVEEIYVEAGEQVKKGDAIARIKIIPDMINLNNAESRISRARLTLENAKQQYERNQRLYRQNAISAADFQQFELNLKNAQEEVDAAEGNLQIIREGATKRTGTATNTIIRSTISGMVLDVPVKEGNQVIESNTFNEGTTIASVADMKDMIFEGKVDESEVGKIKEGMPLILTIGALDKERLNAKLEYISPKGIEENGAIQFLIRAAVELPEKNFIRAGYSANADIILDRRDSVLAINEAMLKFEGDSTYVEVEGSPQQFSKKYIKTGLSDGINIEILSGIGMDTKLKAGEATDASAGAGKHRNR